MRTSGGVGDREVRTGKAGVDGGGGDGQIKQQAAVEIFLDARGEGDYPLRSNAIRDGVCMVTGDVTQS